MRVAASERIGDHILLAGAWKGFDQQAVGAGQKGTGLLQFEPVFDIAGQMRPV